MKKIYYRLTALIAFNAHTVHTITGVYAYNNAASPAALEVIVHYYQKQVPSKVYGGYSNVPHDSTETLLIPLKPGRNILAEFFKIDQITVQKAIITTQSGSVEVPINRTFKLTTGMKSHYDTYYFVIKINPDMSFSITQEHY